MSKKGTRNLPENPGFYFGRTAGFNWFNLIIEISGDHPYLHCALVLERSSSEQYGGLDSVVEFSDIIREPDLKGDPEDEL